MRREMAPPPLDAAKVLHDFSGTVPLFPLPSLVLLPDTVVPLLIFEDRYRTMTKEALEGERLIAMALMKPGWETQVNGAPPIHDRVCIGSIVSHDLLPDGRYKMLLYGLFRAEVLQEVQAAPYRKARVKVLPDVVHESQAADLDERLHRALALIPGRRGLVGQIRRLAHDVRGPGDGPGRLADATAEAARLEADERYLVLAEADVLRRFDLLIRILEKKHRDEGSGRVPPPADPALN
jgi:Lon protease-like protein